MKKTQYITPAIKTMRMKMPAIMAASPGGGDASLPGITDDPGDGPGAGDYGDTPGYGAKFNHHSIWED